MTKKKPPLRISIPADIVLAARELARANLLPDVAALALGVNRATYHKIVKVGEMPLFQRSTVDNILASYDMRIVGMLIEASARMAAARATFDAAVDELYHRVRKL